MGLQSAMTTALTGMQAAETTIDVVGNNVANSNTVGFKESNVLFATQFLQTQSIGSAPSTASGGTNPRQIGLGVTVAEIAPDFTQGTIQVSSNPLDLAIQGDGFFIVQGPGGGAQQFYTRNGQFKTNAVNELTSVNGDRVLGYGVNDDFVVDTNKVVPLTIPLGGSAVAQETNNVNLVGNLQPASEGVATNPGVIDSAILNDNSVEKPANLTDGDVKSVDAASVTLSGATAEAATTPTVAAGQYSYKVVFVDPNAPTGHDEAPASDAFGNVTVPAGGSDGIDLTALPTSSTSGDPSVYTQKRIYRIDLSDPTPQYQEIAQIDATDTTYKDTSAAPMAKTLDTANLDNPGSYNYFVTFSGPNGESRPTDESATIAVSTDGQRIRLGNLPQPNASSADGDFNTINIYRNVAGQPGNFYLVDSIPAHTSDSYIDTKSDAEIEDPTKLLNRNGPRVTPTTPLVDVSTFDGNKYVDLFKPGTLTFTGSKGADGGLDLPPKTLTITSTTTITNLIDFMQEALGIQTSSGDPNHPLLGNPGGLLTGDSRIEFNSNDGVANAVSIKQTAFQLTDTNGSPQAVPLTFSSPTSDPVTGAGTSSEMIAYDSLGIPLTVRLTTSLQSTTNGVTTYRWYATSADNQSPPGVGTTVGTGLVSFNGSGKFISATNSQVTINRTEVASNSPVAFNLDFGQVTALNESTTGLQASSQDGFAAGTLSSFSITESGRIKGVYSNGVTRDLGQLLMARFSNAGGLDQVGDNLYAEGVNSGEPLLDTPGSSGIGSLTAGAVELSNSDIGQNLIDLILASTQYRGGTRVITSAQQLLDELLNLRAA
ncbi:MAG TPA: flagellar hook-basal body complex protein [Lacipirellulaceae bacterium]|nr:flagellar hook-basal body complex protein [Lacipirellulaceae bacterium]